MKINIHSIIGAILLVLITCNFGDAAEKPRWGENVGYKYATVSGLDNEKGLSIREAPESNSTIIAYIRKGTPLGLHNRYKNGWARLKKPFGKGWVNMSLLEKMSIEARIKKSEKGKDCAILRNGPSQVFKQLDCIKIGKKITLDGTWTSGNWALVSKPIKGWVDSDLIEPVEVEFPTKLTLKQTEKFTKKKARSNRNDKPRAGYQNEAERLMNEPLFDPESDRKLQQFLIEEADRRMEMDFRNLP
jgi:SH3-like domain-containing protein